MDAEYAATKIIRAIEKNKPRVKIGKDAYIFHFIMRFMHKIWELYHEKGCSEAGKLMSESFRHMKDIYQDR